MKIQLQNDLLNDLLKLSNQKNTGKILYIENLSKTAIWVSSLSIFGLVLTFNILSEDVYLMFQSKIFAFISLVPIFAFFISIFAALLFKIEQIIFIETIAKLEELYAIQILELKLNTNYNQNLKLFTKLRYPEDLLLKFLECDFMGSNYESKVKDTINKAKLSKTKCRNNIYLNLGAFIVGAGFMIFLWFQINLDIITGL